MFQKHFSEHPFTTKTYLSRSGKCYHLRKALYGLAESSARWHEHLADQLKLYGMTKSKFDPCLFVKNNNSNEVIIAVHVDDKRIATNEMQLNIARSK
mmetsp:Transcript_18636/g.33038  ORF Transcript_18636/g.33038 Transcript_18636/m.33038 type:complete len:97 (+) Transcript_18636:287-577(+)